MKKQHELLLYINMLLFSCHISASLEKINFKQPMQQLITPYPIISQNLQRNLYIHLAALLVIRAHNKERYNNENKISVIR